MRNLGKVQLKIAPSLAIILNGQGSDWCILEKEIKEGATIGDLLADVASSYIDFRKVIFDPEMGEVSDKVIVVLNDSPLQFPHVTEAKLNDGDNVIIIPVYSGG